MASIKDFFGIEIDTEKLHKPSDLYRLIHPELFSDSYVEKEKLGRDEFKFILSRLSTDMRQDAFEELTRRCITKLITPNIIPQTGPTGGGDAKADFITYPVSDNVSALWSVPEGAKGNEMWAFAVSAVQQWSAKMDKDVKKINEHIPGCTRIYFCTNQTVSSRNRDQKQQKYRKEEWGQHETYILDQNWYLQAIFDQGCYNDAVEALGLGDRLKEVKVLGPIDTERAQRLQEIETELPILLSDGINDKYVKELIEAATLARGLGNPEQNVRGRFNSALEAAKKYGLPQQVYECIYKRAWTEFYWYDKTDYTLDAYQELKGLLAEDIRVVRLEILYNIFRILTTANDQGLLKKQFDVQAETNYFEGLYETLKNDPNRPACALFLKICLLEDALIQSLGLRDEDERKNKKAIDDIIGKLDEAIQQAANYLDISFESQVEVMAYLGRLIGSNKKFDDLIDKLTDIQSNRAKDICAAEIQYKRGIQHLDNQNFEGAIRNLTRSYVLYHKENTITYLVRTSGFLGQAYYEQDLLYSAKAYYVRALGFLFKDISDHGHSNHLMVTILTELCHVELRLGQLTTFLEWLSLLDGIVTLMPEYLDEDFLKDRGMMDAILGARLYEATLDDNKYAIVPDILSRHQLEFSRNILLMKMGRADDLSDNYRFLLDSEDTTKKYIAQIGENVEFLFPLKLNANKKAELQTLAHGCNFKVNYSGVSYSQTYSEMVLAFMEMLMDSKTARLFPSTPEIVFEVVCKTEGETKIEQGSNSNEYLVIINKNTFASQQNIWETLIQMMTHVISKNIMVADLESFLNERQEDEYFMQRISLLSGYPNDVKNFFPNIREAYIETFSRTTDRKYDFKIEEKKASAKSNNKQSDAIVTSLIDLKLWDEAHWKGCGYLLTRDFSEPGIMVLLYENIAPGVRIFEKWAEDYQKGELNIRIVIITGVDKKHPSWYKVLITPNMKLYMQEERPKERYVISSSRFHLMNAITDENIKALREAYNRFHFIGLSASAIVNGQMSFDKDKRYNKVIPVRNVGFVEAWTINEKAVESVAIQADDDVIIPVGKKSDAPVLKVIERKKQYGKE